MDDLLPFNEAHYVAEPYAFWARLRDEAPVYWSERNRFWAVTRHDDVLAVLHDPARFSSRGGPSGASEEFGIPRLPMIQDNPPHHDRLRRILSKAFTPRTTAEREIRIREIAGEMMEELRRELKSGGEGDFVQSFSSPFPVSVIAEILGILRGWLRLPIELRMKIA